MAIAERIIEQTHASIAATPEQGELFNGFAVAEPRLHTYTDPFYRQLYNGDRDKSDSPDKSRISLIREARSHIGKLTENDWVLDLGSGPQIFESLYFQANRGPGRKPKCHFATIDRAPIDRKNLLMRQSPRVHHTRADGAALPFGDETFKFVVSNMALDFVDPREKALAELRRVMKTGSHALIRLHHPSIFPDDPQGILDNFRVPDREKRVIRFWEELKRRKALTSNQDQVLDWFENAGFDVRKISLAKEGEISQNGKQDRWWELHIVKTPIEKIIAKKAGKTIAKLIAKTRDGEHLSQDEDEKRAFAKTAAKAASFEGAVMDPSDPNKRFRTSRLISSISQGSF